MPKIEEQLVAPCGMNCAICSGYLAREHEVKSKGVRMSYCTGCRVRDKKCAFLKKKCELLLNNKVRFCHECGDFPCENLRGIDERYRVNFRMSMVENLQVIKEKGMERFLKREEKKWGCPSCGGVICCHNGICFTCGINELKKKKKLYRWED